MFPFISGMIGSSIAAMISVGFGVQAVSIGVGGLPGILSIFFEYWIIYAIAMGVAIVVPFLLTYIIGKNKLNAEDINGKIQNNGEAVTQLNFDEKFINPLEGNIVLLEDVQDQVFSKKLMGEGYAVELTNGSVVAPLSGTLTTVFPTGHAYGLKTDDGYEVLIHVGMDTVELDGKGFQILVEQGQHVNQGQMLAKVDLATIVENKKSLVSPIVFTDGTKVKLNKTGKVRIKEENVLERE